MRMLWGTWRNVTATERNFEAISGIIAQGAAASAGAVQHVAASARRDLARWGANFAGALRTSGVELSAHERRWAERVLGLSAAGHLPRPMRPPTGRPNLRLIVT